MFAILHVFRRLQIVVPAHLPGLSLGRRKIFLSQTLFEVRVVKVVRSVKALARLWGAEMEGKAEPRPCDSCDSAPHVTRCKGRHPDLLLEILLLEVIAQHRRLS